MCSPHEPLDVGRVIYPAKRKAYGYALKVALTSDMAFKIAEITEKANAPLIFIQYSKPKPDEKTAKGLIFMDFTKANSTPQKIMKELKKLDVVEHIKLLKPMKSGMLADTYFFPLVLGDERIVIFRKSIYEGFIAGIKKQFGTAGEAFLYYAGFDVGQRAYKYYSEIAFTSDPKELEEIASALGATMGWATLEVAEFSIEKKMARIRFYNNFECELVKESKEPYSHFLRGVIAGFFNGLFGQGALVKETKCIAKGDNYCEFKVTSRRK